MPVEALYIVQAVRTYSKPGENAQVSETTLFMQLPTFYVMAISEDHAEGIARSVLGRNMGEIVYTHNTHELSVAKLEEN